MLLPPQSAALFIRDYLAVLLEVVRVLKIKPTGVNIEDLSMARSHVKLNPAFLNEAASNLETRGSPIDKSVAAALKTLKIADWIYLRDTAHHSIFIDKVNVNAYAVKGLTNLIRKVAGGCPATFESGLLEFHGQYVCDGLVVNPVYLGPKYRTEYTGIYTRIRKSGRLYVGAAA
jgi:hypothetical protein